MHLITSLFFHYFFGNYGSDGFRDFGYVLNVARVEITANVCPSTCNSAQAVALNLRPPNATRKMKIEKDNHIVEARKIEIKDFV